MSPDGVFTSKTFDCVNLNGWLLLLESCCGIVLSQQGSVIIRMIIRIIQAFLPE